MTKKHVANIAITFFMIAVAFYLLSYIVTAARNSVSSFNPEVEVYVVPAHYDKIVAKPLPKMMLYKSTKRLQLSSKEFGCLARNIFYEAGVEPMIGKIAVAQVTYNRVKAKFRGSSFCSVVYSPKQFSWTSESSKRNTQPSGKLWKESKLAAKRFINGLRVAKLEKSLHYHADYVSPNWGQPEYKVQQIGRHIFYDLSKKPVLVAQKQQ